MNESRHQTRVIDERFYYLLIVLLHLLDEQYVSDIMNVIDSYFD